MDISDDFKAYVAGVVERHFKDAPKPDGTTETNRKHSELKDAAYAELRSYIGRMELSKDEAYEYKRYAENQAQRGIYALFTAIPVKKNKRYKGAKDSPGT